MTLGGTLDAYLEGDTGLALFRGVFFVAGATSIVVSSYSAPAVGGNVQVYRSVDPKSGQVVYVGITQDFAARAAAHFRQKGIFIEEIGELTGFTRSQARGVEQALIEFYGVGKNGGTLLNRINSIARTNPDYAELLSFGRSKLLSIGYPGF